MATHEPKIVSPYGRPNDAFGYAVYSVVVLATPEQQMTVQAVRDAVKNQRSMIPAHVTVKGTFCEISSLDEIKERIARAASAADPFYLEFDGMAEVHISKLLKSDLCTQPIRKTRQLVELHDLLYDELFAVTTNAYGREDRDKFRAHLTVYSEPVAELQQKGRDLAASLDLGSGYPVS